MKPLNSDKITLWTHYYELLSSANHNEHEYIVRLNYGTDAELQFFIVLVY